LRRFRRPRLAHRRLQSLLAVLALGTAVALPVVLLAVGGGVYEHELHGLDDAGYQLVLSSGGVHAVDGSHGLAHEIDGLSGVEAASPILSVPVQVFSKAGSSPALAEGIVPGAFSATQGEPEASLFPDPLPLGDPQDEVHYDQGRYDGSSAGVVLVSGPFQAAQNLQVGETISIGPSTDESLAHTFTVSGTFGVPGDTLGPTAAFGLLLPLSDLQLLTGEAFGPNGTLLDASDTIQVGLAPTVAADPSSLQHVAQEIGRLAPFYTVTTLSSQAAQLVNAEAVLTGFYLGLSAVGLIVGLSFLALVLLREVEMERQAIGIRRALGVPRRDIAAGLLARGYLLASGGAVLGVAIGAGVVTVLRKFGQGNVMTVATLAVFDPATLGELVLAVVALSTLAGWAATRSALRKPITEALR
jgi:hypothetical protein